MPHSKISLLIVHNITNTGNTACSFLLHSLMVLCSRQKAPTQEFFFSPHYCRLIRRQQTGQQLIRAQVRSQAHTLADFPKPTDRCPSYCYGGLPWDLFLIHLGDGKSCRHTETITQQSSWLHGHNTN